MNQSTPPNRLNLERSFPSASKEWKQWLEAFEKFIDHRDASLPKSLQTDRLKALINSISFQTYELIEGCDTYEEAIGTLCIIYAEPPNELLARHLLATKKQESEETLDEFLISLEKLAEDCNFKDATSAQYKQEMIRDAFINGVSSPEIRESLLKNRELNLESTKEIARGVEVVRTSSKLELLPEDGQSSSSLILANTGKEDFFDIDKSHCLFSTDMTTDPTMNGSTQEKTCQSSPNKERKNVGNDMNFSSSEESSIDEKEASLNCFADDRDLNQRRLTDEVSSSGEERIKKDLPGNCSGDLQNETTTGDAETTSFIGASLSGEMKKPADTQIENNNERDLEEKEKQLAHQLRELCDEKGKETDLQKSAQILYELGQLYYLKHDASLLNLPTAQKNKMTNLIKSASLYNAALARKPKNAKKIGNDLKVLCREILILANAKIRNADLIAKAKNIEGRVGQWRISVKRKLHYLPNSNNKTTTTEIEKSKISRMREIQDQITTTYIDIMADLLQFCQQVMGEPPCKFALVGMGSLARKEITPYSDFEHIIVLENAVDKRLDYESILDYFRGLSLIFHIVVINLQETILSNVEIESFKKQNKDNEFWFFDGITTRGICFDSMMPHACKFPIGRQEPTKNKPWTTELIKPVDKMLEYLNFEEYFKNGYHLGDILTKICHVGGEESIFNEFQTKVFDVLNQQDYDARLENTKKMLIEDIDNFATRSKFLDLTCKSFNIKKDFYRSSTIFVSSLGQLNNIQVPCCFDISEALAEKKIITEKVKHKQMYAVALACELRLRWYMKRGKQDDVMEKEDENQDSVQAILNILGSSSVIRYFQITYALQCDIARQFDLKKIHFYTDSTLLNCKLYYRFNQFDKFINFVNSYNKKDVERTDRLHSTEETIKVLEQETNKHENQSNTSSSDEKIEEMIYEIGEKFRKNNSMDEAKELFDIYLDIIDKTDYDQHEKKKKQSKVFGRIGLCLSEMNRPEEAITYLEQMLKISEEKFFPVDLDITVAALLQNIGNCYIKEQKLDKAIPYFQRSLVIQKNMTSDITRDLNVAETLASIGNCYFMKEEPFEALEYLEKSLKIKENASSDPSKDATVATALNDVGRCFLQTGNAEKAALYLEKAIGIQNNVYDDPNSNLNEDHARTLNDMGNCLTLMHRYDEALKCFKDSLEIKKNATLDQSSDPSIAKTLHNMGSCFMDIKKPEKALDFLKKSLEITKKISSDLSSDKYYCSTLSKMGYCLLNLNKPDKAFSNFELSMKIQEKICPDLSLDSFYGNTIYKMGVCLKKVNKPNEASIYFDKAKKVLKKGCFKSVESVGYSEATTSDVVNSFVDDLDFNELGQTVLDLKKALEIMINEALNCGMELDLEEIFNGFSSCNKGFI